MMGDTRNLENLSEEERRKRAESSHDPEFEMPDPEQVDRDREQAERLYGDNEKRRKPAA